MKKSIKKVKKNLAIKKKAVPLCRNQKTNNIMEAILSIRIFLAFSGIVVLAACTVAAFIAIRACKDDE